MQTLAAVYHYRQLPLAALACDCHDRIKRVLYIPDALLSLGDDPVFQDYAYPTNSRIKCINTSVNDNHHTASDVLPFSLTLYTQLTLIGPPLDNNIQA